MPHACRSFRILADVQRQPAPIGQLRRGVFFTIPCKTYKGTKGHPVSLSTPVVPFATIVSLPNHLRSMTWQQTKRFNRARISFGSDRLATQLRQPWSPSLFRAASNRSLRRIIHIVQRTDSSRVGRSAPPTGQCERLTAAEGHSSRRTISTAIGAVRSHQTHGSHGAMRGNTIGRGLNAVGNAVNTHTATGA